MSKGAKIAIIVTLSVLAVFGTCVGGTVWWWVENKEEVVGGIKDSLHEGATFGEHAASQTECVEQGIERSASCGQLGLMCGTNAQLFTQGCLYTAPRTEGICDDIPGPLDMVDTVRWTMAECQERGQTLNNFCGQVLGALQAYCEHPDANVDVDALDG